MEGMRAPCPLWAVRELSVPDLGHQGALPHTGPACVSDKTVHPSAFRHGFPGACAQESTRERDLASVCTPRYVCICYGWCVSICRLGKDVCAEVGSGLGVRNPILSLAFARKTLPRF